MLNSRKGISIVITITLLLIFSITAYIFFGDWFVGYVTSEMGNVNEVKGSYLKDVEINDLIGDYLYVQSKRDIDNLNSLKIGGVDCDITGVSLVKGLNKIDVSGCLGEVTTAVPEVVLTAGNNLVTGDIMVDIDQINLDKEGNKFISVWNVGIDAGFSGINNLRLPLKSAGSYNFNIDWGDGSNDTITAWNQAEIVHNYGAGGVYTVTIDGEIEGFAFNAGDAWTDNGDDCDKLVDVIQWGNLKISDGGEQFSNCENLVSFSATDAPDLSGITDMEYIFASSYSFNGDLSGWDVSSVTDMQYAFLEAYDFNGDVSGWDVSSVTNMEGMFWDASSFAGDLSGWDVSSVTNMQYVFLGASAFDSDLSGWNVSSVTNMWSMFDTASSFNGDVSTWDVSSVTVMDAMFADTDFFNQDLSGWDVSSVESMEGMFWRAAAFNQDLSTWNVSSVDSMRNMFNTASVFNGNVSGWDVSSVNNMQSMFSGAGAFDQDLSGWDVSSVTNMWSMFKGASVFNRDLSSWNVSSVYLMSSMFESASVFNQDLSGWDVDQVTSCTGFDTSASSWLLSKPNFTSCTI